MSAPKSRKGIGRPSRVGPDGYRDVLVRLPIEAWEVLAERAAGSRGGVAAIIRGMTLAIMDTLPFSVEQERGGKWVAIVHDVPGCEAECETPESAVHHAIMKAMDALEDLLSRPAKKRRQ